MAQIQDIELLINIVRYDFTGEFPSIPSGLYTSDEWKKSFLEITGKHGISPFIYSIFERNKEQLPSIFLMVFRNSFTRTTSKNNTMLNELQRLLKIFQAEGIEIIGLKGIAICQPMYQNLGLRPINDLDLLVKEEHYEHAFERVLSRGYIVSGLQFPSEFHKKIWKKIHNHQPLLMHQETGIYIRLQNHIQSPLSKKKYPIENLWAHKQAISVNGVKFYIPSLPELLLDTLLEIQFHYQRNELSLGWLLDIAKILHTKADFINKNEFIEISKPYQKETQKWVTLICNIFGIKNQLFDEKVIENQELINFKKNVIKCLAAGRKQEDNNQKYLHTIKLIPGIFNKFCYIFYDIFASREYIRSHYKLKKKSFLLPYYFLRLKTAITKFFR